MLYRLQSNRYTFSLYPRRWTGCPPRQSRHTSSYRCRKGNLMASGQISTNWASPKLPPHPLMITGDFSAILRPRHRFSQDSASLTSNIGETTPISTVFLDLRPLLDGTRTARGTAKVVLNRECAHTRSHRGSAPHVANVDGKINENWVFFAHAPLTM